MTDSREEIEKRIKWYDSHGPTNIARMLSQVLAERDAAYEEAAKVADNWRKIYKRFNPSEIQDVARADVCEAIAAEIRKLKG